MPTERMMARVRVLRGCKRFMNIYEDIIQLFYHLSLFGVTSMWIMSLGRTYKKSKGSPWILL